MNDISLLRDHPEVLADAFRRRDLDVDLDALRALDERRREVRTSAEEIRAKQKDAGKEIATLQRATMVLGMKTVKLLSLSFSLASSLPRESDTNDFDYLGFWLYSLSGLLIALPLLRGTPASKVAGAMLGLFGVLYQGLIAGVLTGSITPPEIEAAVGIVALPLLLLMLAAVPVFRSSAMPAQESE